jgi:hypothetical protein
MTDEGRASMRKNVAKTARRANHQKSVHPLAQKYFAFAVGQITDLTPRVSPTEGRIAIVTDAGWDAVDAAASGVKRDAGRVRQGSVSDQTAR